MRTLSTQCKMSSFFSCILPPLGSWSLTLGELALPLLAHSLSCLLHRFPMDSFDRVTAMKVMQLRSQETLSGRKEFIVVGTTATYGEDIGTKGRVRN